MNVIKKTSYDTDLQDNSVAKKDLLCESNEDIENTINIFLSAVENLMNRKN